MTSNPSAAPYELCCFEQRISIFLCLSFFPCRNRASHLPFKVAGRSNGSTSVKLLKGSSYTQGAVINLLRDLRLTRGDILVHQSGHWAQRQQTACVHHPAQTGQSWDRTLSGNGPCL